MDTNDPWGYTRRDCGANHPKGRRFAVREVAMRILDTVEDERIIELTNGTVAFVSGARIDSDGSGGNPYNDPYFQACTTFKHRGRSLNPYEVSFVVAHPSIVKKTKGVVMGSQAFVTNLKTGVKLAAVVGDLGPENRLGEVSVMCAKLLGLGWNPNYGGTESHSIGYEILVGVPAVADGIMYELQPWKS